MNVLLIKKLAVAFGVAFGGVLIPALLNVLNEAASGTPQHFGKAVIISLIAGAFGAGLRALLAISPINFIPSDSEHTLVGGK